MRLFQRYLVADALDYHKTMPSSYVDLVITRIPGAVSKFKYGEIFKEWERLLKPGGSGYVRVKRHLLGMAQEAAEKSGLTVSTVIVVVCRNPDKVRGWRESYDTVMYVTKGRAKTFHFLRADKMSNVLYSNGHGWSLPTVKHFVEVSSERGELVLDSFAGDGTVLEACKFQERCAIGLEKDAVWKDVYEDLEPRKPEPENFWRPSIKGPKQISLDSVPAPEKMVKKKKIPHRSQSRKKTISLNEHFQRRLRKWR